MPKHRSRARAECRSMALRRCESTLRAYRALLACFALGLPESEAMQNQGLVHDRQHIPAPNSKTVYTNCAA
jgi:hypothetical protein